MVNVVDNTRRMYARTLSRRLPLSPNFVENRAPSRASRAQQTARSPFRKEVVRRQEEERPMPEHEPNPYALMPPLSLINPSSLMHQLEILNGQRKPYDLDTELNNRRNIENIKRMIDLLDQQRNRERLQDSQEDGHGQNEKEPKDATVPLAKDLGAPDNPSSQIPQDSQFRSSYSPESATVLVARKMQEASSLNRSQNEHYHQQYHMPRSGYAASTIMPYINSGNTASIMSNVRPDYRYAFLPKQPRNEMKLSKKAGKSEMANYGSRR